MSPTRIVASQALSLVPVERYAKMGFCYYRARYYDPEVGRFVSDDPIRFAGGGNLYAYVYNNPLMFGDAFGLKPRPLTPDESKRIRDIIWKLQHCPGFESAGNDLERLLYRGDIQVDKEFLEANEAVGFTSYGFFHPKILLHPESGISMGTLVHEWVHTTQMRGNPLMLILYPSNLLTGRLEDSADAVSEHCMDKCGGWGSNPQ